MERDGTCTCAAGARASGTLGRSCGGVNESQDKCWMIIGLVLGGLIPLSLQAIKYPLF